jgi:hypothetical protein
MGRSTVRRRMRRLLRRPWRRLERKPSKPRRMPQGLKKTRRRRRITQSCSLSTSGELEADLAAAKDNYAGVKTELLGHMIVQDAAEKNKRKARDELEKEKTHSHSLSNNVEHLKRVLQDKEDAIL